MFAAGSDQRKRLIKKAYRLKCIRVRHLFAVFAASTAELVSFPITL